MTLRDIQAAIVRRHSTHPERPYRRPHPEIEVERRLKQAEEMHTINRDMEAA